MLCVPPRRPTRRRTRRHCRERLGRRGADGVVEPWITVSVNGAGPAALSIVSSSPRHVRLKRESTVWGTGRPLRCVSPPESVAVSVSSRYDGYSWSGATKEPLATPRKFWMWCVMAVDRQWCITSDHDSAEAGSVPSSGSVAEPEKLIGRRPARWAARGATIVGRRRRVADADRRRRRCRWRRAGR